MKFTPKLKQKKIVFKPTHSLKEIIRSIEVIDNSNKNNIYGRKEEVNTEKEKS